MPLVLLALVVGYSRVRLGVHYSGDVLAGQLLAIVSAGAVAFWLSSFDTTARFQGSRARGRRSTVDHAAAQSRSLA